MATRSRRSQAQDAPAKPARARRDTPSSSVADPVAPPPTEPVQAMAAAVSQALDPATAPRVERRARPRAAKAVAVSQAAPTDRAPAVAVAAPEVVRQAMVPESSHASAPAMPAMEAPPAPDLSAFVRADAAPAAVGHAPMEQGAVEAGVAPALPFGFLDPVRIAEVQKSYFERWQHLMDGVLRRQVPVPGDKRFSDPSWHEGLSAVNASMYLMNAQAMMQLADAVQGDDKLRERIRFATQQWVDAMSPANFLVTNPEAQKRLVETQGESLRLGMENLAADLKRGRLSQSDEDAFEVGHNVATSQGAVVYQNALFQLVQYTPTTPEVGSRPLLMVPPCINKFYILDLQPDNSLVAHAVSKGHTVFVLSWRNVGEESAQLTWDDYLQQGVFDAIRVVQDISGEEKLNLLGFCVGGTILCTALAALEARGEQVVESLTLLTTLLDFSDPGVLGIFIDEAFVALREQQYGSGGVMPGKELATTFSFLRPNDLVWNYVVNNYLKGERPPAFDLLYWNADSTNLPGPMYAWYLRHMYLQNELRIPNRLVCAGQPIDLGRIQAPAYVFGAREDHIVPWQAAHATIGLLGGPTRYVLGASGHIAGTINSAKKNRRSFWTRPEQETDAGRWLDGAQERPGSWWNDWTGWLEQFKGAPVPAAPPGSPEYPALEAAPGSYVKQRAA